MVLLPCLVILAAYFFFYLPQVQQAFAQQRADDVAAAKAQILDNNFLQLVNQLDGMARLSELRQAMRDSDPVALARMTEEFSLSFSNLDRLAMFPLGELGIASLGEYKKQIRNNIEKDILRRAASITTPLAR